MQVLGYRASTSFGAEPDIAAWSNQVTLNPSRIPPGMSDDAAVTAAADRFRRHVEPGMARMAELAESSQPRTSGPNALPHARAHTLDARRPPLQPGHS
jgi:hypothetical protein